MTTTQELIWRAMRRQPPGRCRLVRLDDIRGQHSPRAALATRGANGQVTLLPEPRGGDMYTAARRVVGDTWGEITGPVAVWAARDPDFMAVFIGPPSTIIYLAP